MSETAGVIVVEDEPLFRDMLARALSTEPSIQVLGETEDGLEAVELARQLDPAAVLMDIELKNSQIDGVEAALRIKERAPGMGIVFLSTHDDRRYVTSLPFRETPGWSYLVKRSVNKVEALVRAIEASIAGMVMLDPEVMKQLAPRSASALSHLTPRQLDVLKLIAEGYNNAYIAGQLFVVEKSVETYINSIYQELGISGEPGVNARVRAAILYLEESQSMGPAH